MLQLAAQQEKTAYNIIKVKYRARGDESRLAPKHIHRYHCTLMHTVPCRTIIMDYTYRYKSKRDGNGRIASTDLL